MSVTCPLPASPCRARCAHPAAPAHGYATRAGADRQVCRLHVPVDGHRQTGRTLDDAVPPPVEVTDAALRYRPGADLQVRRGRENPVLGIDALQRHPEVLCHRRRAPPHTCRSARTKVPRQDRSGRPGRVGAESEDLENVVRAANAATIDALDDFDVIDFGADTRRHHRQLLAGIARVQARADQRRSAVSAGRLQRRNSLAAPMLGRL